MKAGWLIGGMLLALGLVAWSAWGDTRGWLVAHDAATPTNEQGYGRATVEFAQIAVKAEIPLTTELQRLGLGGRSTLGETAGMLFRYPQAETYAFWMKGMKLPLDFIWLVDNTIADITADVPPPSGEVTLPVYRPNRPVTDVLEVQAGFAAKHGLQVGDVVRIDIQ